MKTIILIFSLLFLQAINSQVSQSWVRLFNGAASGDDEAAVMKVDAAGNVYVSGFSTGSGSGHDYTTIKYNSDGVQQWISIYNGPGNALDEVFDMAIDAGGNVYVTGRSYSTQSEYTADIATVKYNSAGVQQWAARYNSPTNEQDYGFAVTVDASGNVYVTGQNGHPALDADVVTIKYSPAGVQLWAVLYDLTGNWDTGNDIDVDALGNVYVTGFHSTDWGTAYLDMVTIKYDAQGVFQWSKGYNGTGNNSDQAVALGLDASGNIYITGYSTGQVYDCVTIKYDPAGTQQWIKTFTTSGTSVDVPTDMKVLPSGNVYITGAFTFNYGTLKYNSSGDLQWSAFYDFNGNFDAASSIAADALENIYVTGESGKAPNETSNDYATIKYNSAGIQQWVQRFDGASSDRDDGNSVGVDNQGNVYVTGFSSGTGPDFGTIKYSESVGVQQISGNIPAGFSLYQNYPNPFNPSTKIRFDLPANSVNGDNRSTFVNVSVYDILGSKVAELVNAGLNPGTYSVDFNAAGFASGMYFYRITAGGFYDTKKLIIIK
jgi:uncharacterized delta-60 repeat protein